MTVAPMIGGIGVAAPLIGNSDTARKCDPAIDHEQLSMRSMIVRLPVVPFDAAEPADLTARIAHRRDEVARNLLAASPVENDANFDATPGGCREGFAKARRNLAGFIDERREVDALPGGCDRTQQRGKYL